MKVLYVVPSFNISKFKGLARYSYEIYRRLKYKIDIEVFEVYKKNQNFFLTFTKVPFKQILSKVNIIHALIPELGSFLWLLSKIRNIKSIVTFHDIFPFEFEEGTKSIFSGVEKLYATFMWKNASKANVVVAQSSQTAKDIRRIFGRKADAIIPPGIDKKFKPKKVKKDKITLGFFANYSYRKGLDKAVEVFKIVKQKYDVKLIIAGGKPHSFYLKFFNPFELTKGLKDVEILGEISEEKIVDLYNSFDFYLFPSLVEGFGIPLLEAQACGIPTLVFEWAKIPKEVTEKAIKCKDVKDMAEKIMYLIENKDEYLKIRREGMKYAKKFDWDKSAKMYLELYEDP